MKRLFLAWLVVFPLTLHGQDLPKSELNFSLGYLFEGEVYLAYPNQYASAGETLLFKVDYAAFVSDFIGLGGYFSYGNPYYDGYDAISMAEVGFVCKARFRAGEKFLLKIPVYVGYRSYGKQAGKGLAVNLSGVLEYQGGNFKPFLDVGFLAQPIGGNDYTDVTFSPVVQASVGVSFSF